MKEEFINFQIEDEQIIINYKDFVEILECSEENLNKLIDIITYEINKTHNKNNFKMGLLSILTIGFMCITSSLIITCLILASYVLIVLKNTGKTIQETNKLHKESEKVLDFLAELKVENIKSNTKKGVCNVLKKKGFSLEEKKELESLFNFQNDDISYIEQEMQFHQNKTFDEIKNFFATHSELFSSDEETVGTRNVSSSTVLIKSLKKQKNKNC